MPSPLLFTVLILAVTNHLCAWPWNDRTLCLVPLGRPLDGRQRRRVRGLLLANLGLSLVAVALCGSRPPASQALWIISLPLLATGGLIALMVSARRAQALARPGRFAVPLTEPPGARAYLSPVMHLLHAVVLTLCAGLFSALLAHMPDRVPLHWNALGQVDGYGSPSTLWGLGAIMLFDWLLTLAVAYGVAIERWALPPDERLQARYRQLQLRRRALIVRLVEAITLGTNVGLGCMWLGIALGTSAGDPVLVTTYVTLSLGVLGLGICVPLVVLLGKTARVQSALSELAGTTVLGTHGNGWRFFGLVYYAPDDPAVFVPKRLGIGQTLNFARPGAWAFLGLVIGAPLVLTWLGTRM